MTFTEMYASLKTLYKTMMFPGKKDAPKWTMTDIDQLDVHFFMELMDHDDTAPQEKERYLSEVW